MKTIEYFPFNIWEQKIGKPHVLVFDFDNSEININGKIYTVISNNEWAYRFIKRGKIIEANNGIKGLYKFIAECCEPKSPFNISFYNRLETV